MPLPDRAFITFYYNDGTYETIQAFTYTMALSKAKKEDPLSFYPFWQYGRNEGENELQWGKEKGWVPVNKSSSDESPEYKAFIANGLDINCNPTTKQVMVAIINNEKMMHVPGFDSDCTYITKEQAMNFFNLVERE